MNRFVIAGLSVLTIAVSSAPMHQGAIARPLPTNAIISQSATLIASGSFVTTEQDHPTEGMARLVQQGSQRYLEFDQAFTTAQGPDVQVVLYRGSSVPVNLEEQNYVTLAPLNSFEGAQRYAIPSDLDLTQFGAVAIWCRQFNVTFGYAAL